MYDSEIPERDPDGKLFFPAPYDLSDVFDVAMIRERKGFIRLPDPGRNRCFDIGGGNKIINGYERLDWPGWIATMPIPADDGSVAAVFSAHALDHMTGEEVVYVLMEVDRVLAPGGTFTIVVPHYASQLSAECIEHKSRFGIKTWRNILANPAYSPHFNRQHEWGLSIGFNMIMGVEERNTVLVTQLIKDVPERVEVTNLGDATASYVEATRL